MSEPIPLVVIAHSLEAAAFQRADVPVLVTGIGKVEATLQLTKRLLEGSPVSEILVYGTAGRLTDNVVFDQVYEVASALEYDALALPELTWQFAGESIATGSDFLHDSRTASELNKRGLTMVDMETYAYARVAKEFNISLRVFKIVSDDADEKSEKLWDENVLKLSEKLLEHYLANFTESSLRVLETL